MKIRVLAILRGASFTADPNDIIVVDDDVAKKLIEAGAAEEVIDEVVEELVLIEEPKVEVQAEPIQDKPTLNKKKR